MFNGLLRTYLGAVEREGEAGGESGLAYLRPETAQGIFINYRNVLQSSRKKLPFGIGQIGKSFRNEITPGNFIFRTREFEQMEMELPGVISLRKDLQICPMPNGIFLRDDCRTFR